MDELDYLINILIEEDGNLKNIKIPTNIEDKHALYRALRNVRNPKPISEDYLRIQDEYLKEVNRQRGIINEKDIPFDKGIMSIWQGDITRLKCDAIVNACNKYLLGCFIPNHSCIDNVIHSYAGMELREECNNIMKGKTLPNGEVILTHGYNLPCKYIIETVGPQVYSKLNESHKSDLRNCYYNTLELCKEKNIKTIAFPCISTGVFRFPNGEACKIAIETVESYLKDNPNVFEHIIFNVFKDEDLKLYREYLNR